MGEASSDANTSKIFARSRSDARERERADGAAGSETEGHVGFGTKRPARPARTALAEGQVPLRPVTRSANNPLAAAPVGHGDGAPSALSR